MADRQLRAAKAANAVCVRLLSHAAKAKRQLPSKGAATSTMMKAANRILIVKTQTVKL
jgi:hypothetical protein